MDVSDRSASRALRASNRCARALVFALAGWVVACAAPPGEGDARVTLIEPERAESAPVDVPRRPNVVLIVTDDQGSIDLGAYGADDLETPQLDRLCRDGVRFTQFYAAAPVCSPSRAALLTGRTPLRAGLLGNVPHHDLRDDSTVGLPTEQVTIAEMLREVGYATAHVGKWHLGHGRTVRPNAQGFDHSFGHLGGCIDNYSHFFYWHGPNRHDLQRNGERVHAPGRFFPDLMVEEADRFMTENRRTPFFLYFALNAPHYPYQGTPDWLERYAGLPSPRREYAAFTSTLDAVIGRVLDRIDALGLRNDTLVIFQSDHGHSTEARAFYGGGSSGPYRGAKFSLLEGGIRVPAVVRWPGRIPNGEERTELVTACDWFPTIAHYCGVGLDGTSVDGRSIHQVIRSEEARSPHSEFHWGNERYWAVRVGRWKLIANARETTDGHHVHDEEGLALYDVVADPGERDNRAQAEPALVADLLERHRRWWENGQ